MADAALMLSALAGPDVRDPLCLADAPEDYLRDVVQPWVRGLRVAHSRDLGLEAVDPEVTALTDAAAAAFATLAGYQVKGEWLEEYGNVITAIVLIGIGIAVFVGL